MRLTREHEADIEALRGEKHETKRVTVPALEEILFSPRPVLDYGHIRLIDYMGDDSAIVQSARVSYGKGTKKVSEDRGLIRYLLRHRHTTPFEMCEVKLHVKLPIFVARQWIRHRTANVNEYSARYSILTPDFYTPRPEHCGIQSTTNRQGRGSILPPDQAHEVQRKISECSKQNYDLYIDLLNESEDGVPIDPNRDGLARELARMVVPVNFYTEWYWKIDLHNLFHFLSLRADAHAQYEVRAYAEVMLEIVKLWVPHAYQAFMDYVMNGMHFSAGERAVLTRMLNQEVVTQKTSGLPEREWNEFQAKLT